MSVVNCKNVHHGVKAKLAAGPFQVSIWQKSDGNGGIRREAFEYLDRTSWRQIVLPTPTFNHVARGTPSRLSNAAESINERDAQFVRSD